MLRLVKTIILCIIAFISFSQDSINITGTIKDFYTKQQLPYANISVKDAFIGTSSDMFGKYKLRIPKSSLPIELIVNYMGYELASKTINQKRNQNQNFLLYPKSIDINEVSVKSEKAKRIFSRE